MPGLASDQGPIFVFQLVLVTIFVTLHFSVLCAHLFTYIPVNRRACTTMDKKKNHPWDLRRGERCSTCDIMLDHARSAQGKSRGWPCPALIAHDQAWCHKIEQRSSRRESRGWFFFLSRVVVRYSEFFGQVCLSDTWLSLHKKLRLVNCQLVSLDWCISQLRISVEHSSSLAEAAFVCSLVKVYG